MRYFLLLTLLLFVVASTSQDINTLRKIKPDKDYENIFVKKIDDSAHQTSFLIWVKNNVPLHKHASHTESIYVISGKGEMIIGEKVIRIEKGDFFTIPKNTAHGLKVLSNKPIKVLSIQAPHFDGSDRILLEPSK